MADLKPTATTAKSTSVQPKKSGNSISWIAPVVCILIGYIIWRFALGSESNFTTPHPVGKESNFFFPGRENPIGTMPSRCLGGFIVPVLILCLLTVVTFCIERFM